MTVSLPPVIKISDTKELLPPVIKINNQTFRVEA